MNSAQRRAKARARDAEAERLRVLEAWLRKPTVKDAPPNALPAARALVQYLVKLWTRTDLYDRLAREDLRWNRVAELKTRFRTNLRADLSFRATKKASYKYSASYWKSTVRSPTLKGTNANPEYDRKVLLNWNSGRRGDAVWDPKVKEYSHLAEVSTPELVEAKFTIDTLDSSCSTIESAIRMIEWLRAAISLDSDLRADRSAYPASASPLHQTPVSRKYSKASGSSRKYRHLLSPKLAIKGGRGRNFDSDFDPRRGRALSMGPSSSKGYRVYR